MTASEQYVRLNLVVDAGAFCWVAADSPCAEGSRAWCPHLLHLRGLMPMTRHLSI